MKKFRILALVMTCAILLSSFAIIPVSAETELDPAPADAELVYTVNFKGDDGENSGIKFTRKFWI